MSDPFKEFEKLTGTDLSHLSADELKQVLAKATAQAESNQQSNTQAQANAVESVLVHQPAKSNNIQMPLLLIASFCLCLIVVLNRWSS